MKGAGVMTMILRDETSLLTLIGKVYGTITRI